MVSFTFVCVCFLCCFFQYEASSSFVCDEGYGQRKQAGQKGENCGSQGVTE